MRNSLRRPYAAQPTALPYPHVPLCGQKNGRQSHCRPRPTDFRTRPLFERRPAVEVVLDVVGCRLNLLRHTILLVKLVGERRRGVRIVPAVALTQILRRLAEEAQLLKPAAGALLNVDVVDACNILHVRVDVLLPALLGYTVFVAVLEFRPLGDTSVLDYGIGAYLTVLLNLRHIAVVVVRVGERIPFVLVLRSISVGTERDGEGRITCGLNLVTRVGEVPFALAVVAAYLDYLALGVERVGVGVPVVGPGGDAYVGRVAAAVAAAVVVAFRAGGVAGSHHGDCRQNSKNLFHISRFLLVEHNFVFQRSSGISFRRQQSGQGLR